MSALLIVVIVCAVLGTIAGIGMGIDDIRRSKITRSQYKDLKRRGRIK